MRRRILITGASSGLGAEMARGFAARGCSLALCARRVERLVALRDDLVANRPGIDVAVRALDVDDPDAVPRVFAELRDELGGLDRVIVNAGIGHGRPVGSGRPRANRATATTNFLSALTQCEAAMEIFRAQHDGHLVVISSFSAVRGLPGAKTVYAASKAGLSALAEGIRIDAHGTGITVSTMLPGYIRSEINERAPRRLFAASTEKGVAALVAAIEREPARAYVPRWPWAPLARLVPLLPAAVVRRIA